MPQVPPPLKNTLRGKMPWITPAGPKVLHGHKKVLSMTEAMVQSEAVAVMLAGVLAHAALRQLLVAQRLPGVIQQGH